MRAKTSAKGTTICGSSSRGVTASASAPASSEPRSSRIESFEVMKTSTILAVSPRAAMSGLLHEDQLARVEAREDLERPREGLAGPHVPRPGHVLEDADRLDLARA